MYCKKCGFQLSDNAKFCPNCGTMVEINGMSDIESKAVFGNIDDNEQIDLHLVQDKATWTDEEKLSQVDSSFGNSIIIERNKQTFYEYRNLIKSKLNTLYAEKEKSEPQGGCIIQFIGFILFMVGIIMGDNWIWLAVIGFLGPIILFIFCIMSEDENRIHSIEQKIDIYNKAYDDLLKVPFSCEDYESKIKNIYNKSINKASKIKGQ